MANKLKGCAGIEGRVTILKNGKVESTTNLTMDDGRKWIAERICGSTNPATHIGVGEGTTEPTVTDTSLESELMRQALDVAGGTSNANVSTFRSVFREGEATGAITEAGLFLAGSGGRMTNRATFPVVNKGANDVVTIIWDIEILATTTQ